MWINLTKFQSFAHSFNCTTFTSRIHMFAWIISVKLHLLWMNIKGIKVNKILKSWPFTIKSSVDIHIILIPVINHWMGRYFVLILSWLGVYEMQCQINIVLTLVRWANAPSGGIKCLWKTIGTHWTSIWTNCPQTRVYSSLCTYVDNKSFLPS